MSAQASGACVWRIWARRVGQVLGLVIGALLLAGCGMSGFFADTPEVPLELDYNRLLPEGWKPIAQWYEVDIDGDGDTEYLLLFTYDAGQVGAVIYDQQVSTDLVAPLEEMLERLSRAWS
ncbi:MAG: hypothetical protein WDZ49_02645, partial [Litorilinea sp.]